VSAVLILIHKIVAENCERETRNNKGRAKSPFKGWVKTCPSH